MWGWWQRCAVALVWMLVVGLMPSWPGHGVARAAAGAVAGQRESQLVLGSLEEPASLSALADLPHHFPEHVPQTLIFDSLTQLLPDSSLGPRLAESWEGSGDGLSWTFRLNRAARWHDGVPVTAADVAFTFTALLDPNSGASTEGVTGVERAEALDDATVRITLKGIDPRFLAQGGARGIVPRHVLEGQDLLRTEFNRQPIGSGPYRVVAFVPSSYILFEANPFYFRGVPRIGRVVFKILPDQNVILTQLRSGEIQYALLTPRDLRAVADLPGLRVVENPTYRFYDIAPNYDRSYFQDRRVRQALLHGIDREGIVQGVLLGRGLVMHSFVTPLSWAYTPQITRYPYDPERARTLLDEAGWALGADGIRQRNGERLAFTVMVYTYDRTLQQALTVAQQDLRALGIDMQVQPVEPGVYAARRKNRDFDALSRIWNPVYDPDQAGLIVTGNFYGYSNPEADRLARAALLTSDREQRRQIYAELQAVLAEDVARLWLYSENELHALPATLKGVQPHPVNLFWNLQSWALE